MVKLLHVVRRGPVIVGLVVLVLAGGGVAWAMSRSSGSTGGSSTLVAAAVNTVTSTVSASGTIEAAHEADLDFAVTGRVTKVEAKVGDTVTKGQRLATVSRAALSASKAAAQAAETAAADTVAADTSATSASTAAADKASLTAAQSALHSAKQALTDSVLRSTIAGTVTGVDLSVGQQVSGGASTAAADTDSSSGSSDSQVVVQSAKSFVVDATVDDTEITQVHKGQSVAVTPSGAAAPVTGTVTSVSSVPSSSSGVVSFPIVIAVSGHPDGVYAGAGATLSITTKKAIRALEIPTFAVHYDGSKATVQVNDGGGAVTRSITVGTTYGLETQVLSGLKAGDKVVVTLPSIPRVTNRGTGGGTGGFGGGGFGGGNGGFGNGGFGSGGFGGGGGG